MLVDQLSRKWTIIAAECVKTAQFLLSFSIIFASTIMGWKCYVPNCHLVYFEEDNTSISFHAFPLKDYERTKKWVRAIHRNDYFPTINSWVYSKHFSESDFKHTNCDVNMSRVKRRTEVTLKLRLLKDNAVPSIFPGQPAYMSKNQEVKRSASTTAEAQLKTQMDKLNMLKSAWFGGGSEYFLIFCFFCIYRRFLMYMYYYY